MKAITALFDSGGTLYSAHFAHGLKTYMIRQNNPELIRHYYISTELPYKIRKLLGFREEPSLRLLIKGMVRLLKGMSERDADVMFNWIINEYLLPTQYEDVILRMREHQAKGHEVVLVSGMFAPALMLIASVFDFSHIIGTRIEIKNGCYTGRVIPPEIIAQDKVRSVRSYFSSRKIEIGWAGSFAYGDLSMDIGLFDMVGHPVAVSPDKKLYNLAISNNWEVIGLQKSA